MSQDPAERLDAVARGSGFPVPGARRKRWRLHSPTTRTDASRSLFSLETLRRVFEKHADRNGKEGGNPDTVGNGDCGLRGGKWRTCQHTRRISGKKTYLLVFIAYRNEIV